MANDPEALVPPKPWLTVGEVAARSGVSVSALHFFERQGLLSSTRTSGNQRRYRRDALRRVALIRIAQRIGIPLKELAEVLAQLPDQATPTRADWAPAVRGLARPTRSAHPPPSATARRVHRLCRLWLPVHRPLSCDQRQRQARCPGLGAAPPARNLSTTANLLSAMGGVNAPPEPCWTGRPGMCAML